MVQELRNMDAKIGRERGNAHQSDLRLIAVASRHDVGDAVQYGVLPRNVEAAFPIRLEEHGVPRRCHPLRCVVD